MHLALFLHLLGEQGSNSVSHLGPVKGTSQTHWYESTKSIQDPPFRQGLLAQSSILVSQFCPLYPGKQEHS